MIYYSEKICFCSSLSVYLRTKQFFFCLEEQWDAVELKLDSRRVLIEVVFWKAVLQDRWKGNKRHRAIRGAFINTNLKQKEGCALRFPSCLLM